MIDAMFFEIHDRNVLAARVAMNKWIAEQDGIEIVNVETIVKQKNFIFGGICLAGLRIWYKQVGAVTSTETEEENSKALERRAVFESLLQVSAEEAGFDSNINLERSDEFNESYADSCVQAAWYGFKEGVKLKSAVI